MTPKRGRPRSQNPRDHAVHIRFTKSEIEEVARAAESADMTVGEWLRVKALAAAERGKSKR